MSESPEQHGFVAPDPADLAPLFPGYEIQSLIATGGMGAVYCAVQKSLDRTVALKILPMELSKDAAFCAGFEAEAKAMARLNHPNLIGVYDFGEVNGMLFIIMEYVPGKSIYHSAYGKSIAPQEVVRLVTGVCHGLAHAHENGIIHRDIKPSNILLDLNAEPKIGDFGLARPIERKVEEGEEIFGTPHYTAPEVVNAPHSVDYRADIFSVGVLLHELLTGRLPADDPRPASTIVHCDTRFDAIIRKATQPLAAARYSSAKEIARDLQAIASATGPQGPRGPVAGPQRPVVAPRSFAKARPKKSSGSTVMVFLAAAALAAFGAYFFILKKPPVEPVKPTVVILPAAPPKPDKPGEVPVVPADSSDPADAPEPGETAQDSPPVNPTPPVEETPSGDPEADPEMADTSSDLPAPKYDVPAFFERARKIMKDKAKPALSTYDVGLKDNFTSFERAIKRQTRRFDPGEGPPEKDVEAALSELRASGTKIPADLDSTLSPFAQFEEIRAQYYQSQTGLVDTLNQSLSQLSSLYVVGLEKQIERLKADNDAGAIALLEKEIESTRDDPEYFPGLMTGNPVAADE